MTRITDYPEGGIKDVVAWKTEVGLVAYRDGQLDLPGLAIFLGKSQLDAWRVMQAHGMECTEDELMLAQELNGIAYYESRKREEALAERSAA